MWNTLWKFKLRNFSISSVSCFVSIKNIRNIFFALESRREIKKLFFEFSTHAEKKIISTQLFRFDCQIKAIYLLCFLRVLLNIFGNLPEKFFCKTQWNIIFYALLNFEIFFLLKWLITVESRWTVNLNFPSWKQG